MTTEAVNKGAKIFEKFVCCLTGIASVGGVYIILSALWTLVVERWPQ